MRRRSFIPKMTIIGLMAAIICLLGPFSVFMPLSPVPISLCTLAIYFVIYVLGSKLGTCSVAIYILLGLCGLPVFSGFTGGIGRLLGATGGYIIGYLFIAFISGVFIDRWGNSKKLRHLALCFLGMLLGTVTCYLFGTLWLSYHLSLSFTAALTTGVLPYILPDFLKLFLAMTVGYKVRKRLTVAGLIDTQSTP